MTYGATSAGTSGPRTIAEKIIRLNWPIITLLVALAAVGVATHLSVSDAGWADMPMKHAMRFGVLLAFAIIAAILLDANFWLRIAYPLYGGALLLLVAVEVAGETRMGAQRWLALGPVTLQPSEIMKVAIVLALARYYHGLDPRRTGTLLWHLPALAMIGAPVALIMHQPDLGTSMLIVFSGAAMMFLGGLLWRIIGPAIALGAGGAVYAYNYVLHGYQRDRVNVFLGLSDDPLGAGYHVLQSKIAVGSAGLFGRGYGKGVQSQGDFLPEKNTDFIYTMIVEQWGLVGGLVVLGLYGALMWMAVSVGRNARSMFGKLVAAGVAVTLASYVLINTAMVIGLAPVVGIPLPLISFGGTAMMTLMVCFSVVLSIDLHPDHAGARGLLW